MNTSLRSLADRFRRARLDLELLSTPLLAGRPGPLGTEAIVQIDIAPPGGTQQRFRIFPGASENRLEVLGPDPRARQLVLFVDEPRRAFSVWLSKRQAPPPAARILREDAKSRLVEQFTEGRKRHFLCGMDEQHLFIAELPCGASSTHAAREALRAPEVPQSLVLRGERIVRQGEWFFLPTLPRERAELDEEVGARRVKVQRCIGIAQAAKLARAGRPHVADEVVVLPAGGPRIYVRGAVQHPEHRTVEFRSFVRVVPNRERFAQPAGVLWID